MARRTGFTLVELLVVIAIIGVLVALLLAALQGAREAARAIQCRNHLKQIGLAALHYHEWHKVYATHVDQRVIPIPEQVSRGRWPVKLLPFLEQENLYDAWREAFQDEEPVSSATEARRTAIVGTSVSTYYCPSRRPARPYPKGFYFFGGVPDDDLLYARIDYAVNGGSSRRPGDFNTDFPGIWEENETIRGSDVVDGLSQTYLFGEKAMATDFYTSGLDRGDFASIYHCVRGACMRFAKNSPIRDPSGAAGSCFSCHDFGSAHPGAWNAAYCDGSVHSMSYGMAFEIHSALASRDAGDLVGDAGF